MRNAGYDMQLRPPRTVYEKIFCPNGVRVTGESHEYTVSKASRYGGHLRHRHDGNLDKATALHWLLHNAHGAATLSRLNLPAEEVADLLVRAAAMHPTEKREAPKMQNMDKTLREVGEATFTKMVERYAKTIHPTLTRERAFTKVFTEDSDEGRAIRRAWQISKGQDIAAGALDEPSDDEDDDENALDELNELAAEERRRNPKLTKQAAFTKVYTDPANAKLAARERRANRPR